MRKSIALATLLLIISVSCSRKNTQASLPIQTDSINVIVEETITAPLVELPTTSLFQYKNIQFSIPKNWSKIENDSTLSIIKDSLTNISVKVNDFNNDIELNAYYEQRMKELSPFQPDGVLDNSSYEITYLNDDVYNYRFCIWNDVDVVTINFSCPVDDYDTNNEVIYDFISSIKL